MNKYNINMILVEITIDKSIPNGIKAISNTNMINIKTTEMYKNKVNSISIDITQVNKMLSIRIVLRRRSININRGTTMVSIPIRITIIIKIELINNKTNRLINSYQNNKSNNNNYSNNSNYINNNRLKYNIMNSNQNKLRIFNLNYVIYKITLNRKIKI